MGWIKSSNLGYPRIGEKREWKKTLESYWAGQLDQNTLEETMKEIRLNHLRKQIKAGIDWIPVGDFNFYDHMLDMAAMFGLVPQRFQYEGGPVSLDTYFAMARGNPDSVACEMTKWFNTNYHYIVPELDSRQPSLTENKPLMAYKEARDELGLQGKPVLIGPFTFLMLSKGANQQDRSRLLEQFVPLYAHILQELETEGVRWVQIDEPILVTSLEFGEVERVREVYRYLHQAAPSLHLFLQTYFDAVECYPEIVDLPVQGIGLDFVAGKKQNLKSLQTHGFPKDKVLGIGLVDGRNIWRTPLQDRVKWLKEYFLSSLDCRGLVIQPSCSLSHVPVSLKQEKKLEPVLREAMAFADEKLEELNLLTCLLQGKETGKSLDNDQQGLERLSRSPARNRKDIQEAVSGIRETDYNRKSPFQQRKQLHQKRWQLPLFPTTTIGSLPQTAEVRSARHRWRQGEWPPEKYHSFLKGQIREWIKIQEEIGLDVLVHGEFERSDMVEFFGEKLDGFAFTQNGWVQSYGSRCVKPPVIYGDVACHSPMTVKESVYAQSLTDKPVKGMLTGPTTILNWSFVRDDITRREVVQQIALALRQEIHTLQSKGIHMIQVDEPALREGLPLKKQNWESYLNQSIKAFRLATSSAADTTQIHTHMCYSEFQDIMGAIRELDADVLSIETSRSHGELIRTFEFDTYDKGIGLGVYDIHSPRIPETEEMTEMIRRAIRVLDPSLFWINPDCGLKTRTREEVIPALQNMVQAAHRARKEWKRIISTGSDYQK